MPPMCPSEAACGGNLCVVIAGAAGAGCLMYKIENDAGPARTRYNGELLSQFARVAKG